MKGAVHPRSYDQGPPATPSSRQGPNPPTALTLATMTALEPRDTDVADTAPDLGAVPEEGVLGRPYRALSIGIVSVVLLIAFEATAVGTPIAELRRAHYGHGLTHH